MDKKAIYKLTYGLFLLSAREGDRDNACVVNTVQQAASDPVRLSVAVINANYTREMISRTGVFNVSVLDKDTPFSAFEQFGFQSGRDTDKLKDYWFKRTDNGLAYFPQFSNAVFSAKVVDHVDLGSHTLFIGELTEAIKLSDVESLTYERYQNEIKPKKAAAPEVKGWRCTVCGYIYESEELPADFICPVCKHGAEVFERI
jgi:flavin reductase (DIM6/NTAB) family NADH-FMN oxidoreductase RutF/rubredoxin